MRVEFIRFVLKALLAHLVGQIISEPGAVLIELLDDEILVPMSIKLQSTVYLIQNSEYPQQQNSLERKT